MEKNMVKKQKVVDLMNRVKNFFVQFWTMILCWKNQLIEWNKKRKLPKYDLRRDELMYLMERGEYQRIFDSIKSLVLHKASPKKFLKLRRAYIAKKFLYFSIIDGNNTLLEYARGQKPILERGNNPDKETLSYFLSLRFLSFEDACYDVLRRFILGEDDLKFTYNFVLEDLQRCPILDKKMKEMKEFAEKIEKNKEREDIDEGKENLEEE